MMFEPASILWLCAILPLVIGHSQSSTATQTRTDGSTLSRMVDNSNSQYTWDQNGYIFFCLCMGRFGNQADHFLGGLAFAKQLNRTFVVPPWRTYKNIPFTDWFRLESLAQYHRVILAEEFMEHLAADRWPPDNRIGYCFSYTDTKDCKMKTGNPFGPFWDGLGVNFVSSESYDISFASVQAFKKRFPPSRYPVLALKGAPAAFPIVKDHRKLQQYLQWSDFIITEAQKYIQANFPDQKFLGIHLRNGKDWENACAHAEGSPQYMASPQCFEPNSGPTVTADICLPPLQEILRLTRQVVESTEIKIIYVATDQNPFINELTSQLADHEVKVFHQDPWLPQIDLYTLGQADQFIGNCVSSFTSFVARERTVNNKPTLFWGFS